jgi:hypothetical protein
MRSARPPAPGHTCACRQPGAQHQRALPPVLAGLVRLWRFVAIPPNTCFGTARMVCLCTSECMACVWGACMRMSRHGLVAGMHAHGPRLSTSALHSVVVQGAQARARWCSAWLRRKLCVWVCVFVWCAVCCACAPLRCRKARLPTHNRVAAPHNTVKSACGRPGALALAPALRMCAHRHVFSGVVPMCAQQQANGACIRGVHEGALAGLQLHIPYIRYACTPCVPASASPCVLVLCCIVLPRVWVPCGRSWHQHTASEAAGWSAGLRGGGEAWGC